ncbi:MAG: alpha/beta hydrolase-fold protein, partial [Planctomycetota bacterium]
MTDTIEHTTIEELHTRIAASGAAALAGHSFPFVDGGRALFVYAGPAEEVRLHHWIFGLESAQEFHRTHPEVWTLEVEVQDGARVEYKLEVVQRGERQLTRDPQNEAVARDPFGANSVVTGVGYEEPWWALEDRSKRQGQVLERQLRSDVFGDVRPLSIYLPPRYRENRRYPLLIVHDGLDYLGFTNFKTVLDNLIDVQEIPPLVACFTQSPNRVHEYAASDRHADFVANELVPLMDEEFSLQEGPGERALMGASFGAVASLHTALRHPGTFDKLLLQSGSFAFTDIGPHERGPLFDPVVAFVNDYRRAPVKPAERVFLSCGTYESLIVYNRSLLPMLQRTGAEATLVEAQDGHNWENWRDRLRAGLTW